MPAITTVEQCQREQRRMDREIRRRQRNGSPALRSDGGEIRYSQPIETPVPAAITTRAADAAAFDTDVPPWGQATVDAISDAIGMLVRDERLERERDVSELRREISQLCGKLDGVLTCLRSVGGLGIALRGTYESGAEYSRHDIVALNGSSFIAKQDRPGACPGPNWALLSSKGGRGEKGRDGLRGPQGEKGEPAERVRIKIWSVDVKRFCATPIMSDGTIGANLELKPMLQEFLNQITASR
jgi:hypothetical protein